MPIRAILFDVYGTLLDVHSAIAREGKELGARADGGLATVAAEATRIYVGVVVARRVPQLPRLTESALDFALAAHGIEFGALRDRLLLAYEQLDAFPEVAGALQALQRQGLRMAALSNGDPDMLENGLRAAGIRDALEAVLSVAPLRIFKPDRSGLRTRPRLGRCAAGRDRLRFGQRLGRRRCGGVRLPHLLDQPRRPADEYDIPRHATIITRPRRSRRAPDLAQGRMAARSRAC